MILQSPVRQPTSADSAAPVDPRYIEFSTPAWIEHIPFAFWVVKALRPRQLVELGTHYGNSYFAFCEAVAANELPARTFAIDTWQGDEHSGRYRGAYEAVVAHNEQHYGGFSRLVRSTFDEALPHFPDGSIDLLHIDGLHSYEACKHDFDTWLPKMSERGVVLFHDTNVREWNFGVYRLWAELTQRYPGFEFIHGNGLGVLGVGSAIDGAVQGLLAASLDPVETSRVRDEFWRSTGLIRARLELHSSRVLLAAREAEVEEQLSRIAALKRETATLAGQLESIHASRSWRITAPLRRLSAILGRGRLRWRTFNAMECISTSGFVSEWRMTGNNPYIVFDDPSRGQFQAGHYRLIAEFPQGFAHLVNPGVCLDTGQGFDAGTRMRLRFVDGGRGRAIAELALGLSAKSIRFEPGEASGTLVLGRVWLRRVPRLLHYSRLAARLAAPRMSEPASLLRAAGRALSMLLTHGPQAVAAKMRKAEEVELKKETTPEGFGQMSWLAYRRCRQPIISGYIRRQLLRMPAHPLITIILPTFETPGDILRETLASVLAQAYPNWQLCVVDDGSRQPHVRDILTQHALRDRRIRVSYKAESSGISAASNEALAMADGEYVVLLDHDDRLEEHALLRLAESIVQDNPDMIYSDEALLSVDGTLVTDFVFRPSFSLEFLRAHPYIVHLVAFRTSLLRQLCGFDETLKISQDYDLILRVAEIARTIVHIPEVLYFWRQRPGSAGEASRDRVMDVSARVLNRHLARCGESATASPGKRFNFFDVSYGIQDGLRVAILIPTKNHHELVRQCIESIERTVGNVACDIILIDHDSTNGASLDYFAELAGRHRVLRCSGPFNFSRINNWAIEQLATDKYTHYLFCNNDIEAIENGWLERMLGLGQKPDVGVVGANLFYPDGRTFQHAGVCVGMMGAAEHFGKFADRYLPDGEIDPGYLGYFIADHELSAVTAACMLVRSDAFRSIGGFDESLAVGFGDIDLCLRVREAGFRVIQCAQANLLHHESFTRGKPAEGGILIPRTPLRF